MREITEQIYFLYVRLGFIETTLSICFSVSCLYYSQKVFVFYLLVSLCRSVKVPFVSRVSWALGVCVNVRARGFLQLSFWTCLCPSLLAYFIHVFRNFFHPYRGRLGVVPDPVGQSVVAHSADKASKQKAS